MLTIVSVYHFFPKLYQILLNAPRIHSNTTECNQMGLSSQAYSNAPKYSQTPPNTSNTKRCPRVFLNATKRYQMLQDAPKCFHAFRRPYGILLPSAPTPASANTSHATFLKTGINEDTTTNIQQHTTHQHECSSEALPPPFREHLQYHVF